MRTYLSIFLVVFLAACTQGRAIDYNQQIQSWVGSDTDHLVRAWGPPDRSYTFRDNTSVIEYIENHIDDYGWDGFPTVGYSHGTDGGAVVLGTSVGLGSRSIRATSCVTTFEANKKGVVTNASYKGSFCHVPEGALKHF